MGTTVNLMSIAQDVKLGADQQFKQHPDKVQVVNQIYLELLGSAILQITHKKK